MSREIDERVVQMELDNKDFENNCKETLSSLDKLKEALKFKGASDGFNEIEESSKSFGSSLDKLSLNFSALEYVALNVMSNIATGAVEAGLQLAKSMSIDQVTAGWAQYNAMVSSEQTMMSALTGKTNPLTGIEYVLDDVREQLGKLQWYSDETSYNMSQMGAAISEFTAAGVDLYTSTDAIIGVSNACAEAGITADRASSAYTAMVKAISAGAITTGIWNKELRTSGLSASEKYRQSLIDAGVAMGTLQKIEGEVYAFTKKGEAIAVTTANIADTLTETMWATAEVATLALDSYSTTTDALYSLTNGGYLDTTAAEVQNLVSVMEDAGMTLADLGLDQEFDTASAAIETLTNAYKELGLEVPKSLTAMAHAQEAISFSQAFESVKIAVASEFSQMFEMIFGNYDQAKQLWTSWANDMWDIFVSPFDDAKSIVEQWASATAKVYYEWDSETGLVLERHISSQELWLETLSKLMTAISNIVWAIRDGWNSVLHKNTEEGEDNLKIVDKLVRTTAKFADWVDSLNEKLQEGQPLYDKISRTVAGISAVFQIAKKVISAIISPFTKLFSIFRNFEGNILDVTASIGDYLVSLNNVIDRSEILVKITDVLSKFFGGIAKGIEAFVSFAKPIAKKIISWFKEDLIPVLGDVLSYVKNNFFPTISDFFSKINLSFFENKKISFKNIFSDLKKLDLKKINKLFNVDKYKEAFRTLLDAIPITATSIYDNLKKAFKVVLDAVEIFFEDLLGRISNGVTITLNFLDDVVSKDTVQKLLEFAKLITSLIGIIKITKAIESIGGFFDSLSGLVSAFKNKVFGVSKSKIRKVAETMLILGGALFLISVSLTKLSSIDPGALQRSTLVIGILLAEITLLSILVNRSTELVPKGWSTVSVFGIFAGIAIAVLAFGIEVQKLGKMNSSELLKGLATITVMGLVVSVMSVLINASGKVGYSKKTISTFATLSGIAIALAVFASVIKKLGKIPPQELAKSLTVIGILAVVISIMSLITNASNGIGKQNMSLKSFDSLIGIAAILFVFGTVIKTLGKLSEDELAKGLTAITIISIIIETMMLVIGLTSRISGVFGANAITNFGSFIGIALLISVFAISIKKLGDIPEEALWRGLGVVTLMSLIVDAMIIVIGTAGKIAGGKVSTSLGTFVGVAVTMATIAGLVVILGNIPKDVLKQGLTYMSWLIGDLSVLIVAIGYASKGTTGIAAKMFGIIATVTLTTALAVAIGFVGELAPSVIDNGLKIITKISAVLAGLSLVLGFVGKFGGSFGQMVSVLGVAELAIIGLGGIVFAITKLGITEADRGGLSVVADAFTSMIPIILTIGAISIAGSKFEANFASMISIIGAIELAIVGLGGIVFAITKLGIVEEDSVGIHVVTKAIEGLLPTFAVLGLASEALSLIGSDFVSMISFIGATELAIVGLGGIVFAITKLGIKQSDMTSISITTSGINALLPAFVAIGLVAAVVADMHPNLLLMLGAEAVITAGIGMLITMLSLCAKLVANTAVKISAKLPTIADNLAVFAEKLSPFAQAMRSVEDGTFSKLIPLAEGLVNLNKASNKVDAVELTTFIESLSPFAEAMRAYAYKMGLIQDWSVVEKSTIVASYISDFASTLQKHGGSWQKIVGDNSLAAFGEEMVAFAPLFVTYSKIISGISDWDSVTESSKAATLLTDFANKLEGKGGLLQDILGSVSIKDFGAELALFAPSLKTYANIIEGVSDWDSVTESAKAASLLADFASALEGKGGLLQDIIGTVSLKDFASELSAFAPEFKAYAMSMVQITDWDAVLESAKAATLLAEFANTLSKEGGFLQKIVGETSLSDFASDLSAFAPSFVAYTQSITAIPENAEAKSMAVADIIQKLNDSIPPSGSIFSVFTGEVNFEYFGTNLVSFGKAVYNYSIPISKIPNTLQTKSDLAANTVAAFAKTIEGQKSAIKSVFNNLVDIIGDKLKAFGEKLRTYNNSVSYVNASMMSSITEEVKKLIGAMTAASNFNTSKFNQFLTSIDNLISSLKSYSSDFKLTGQYMMEGLIDGINSYTYRVKQAAKAVAQSAKNAANQVLGINSPSKEFAKIGMYSDIGFAEGLEKYSNISDEAASMVGTSAMAKIKDSIKNMQKLIDDGVEINPTITPLIDLSEIQNGINKMDSLVGSKTLVRKTSAQLAYKASAGFKTMTDAKNNVSEAANIANKSVRGGNTFTNTFNITGNNPKEIANEVSKIIARQVERKQASWA